MVPFSFSFLFPLFYFVSSTTENSGIVLVAVFKTQIFVKRRVIPLHPQEKGGRVAGGDADKSAGTYRHSTNPVSYEQHAGEHRARTKTRIPSLGSNLFPRE